MNASQIEALSNDELRDLLVKYGQNVVGPVVKTTRKVYENKLKKLLSGGGASPTSPANAGRRSQIPQPSPAYSADATATSTSSPGSIGLGGAGATSPWNRSRNTYGDASTTTNEYDDDLMEGEESFRYVGPVNDSPVSPYSALGGSMIATPPRTAKPATTSTPAARPDFGYSPTKPASSYTFSSRLADGSASKSSTISYHTTGSGVSSDIVSSTTEPYRRTFGSSAVGPRTAEPRIPYAEKASSFSVVAPGWTAKAKRLIPWLVKILGAIVLIVFISMVIKRAMRSGMGDEEDDSFKLPA